MTLALARQNLVRRVQRKGCSPRAAPCGHFAALPLVRLPASWSARLPSDFAALRLIYGASPALFLHSRVPALIRGNLWPCRLRDDTTAAG